MMVIVLNKFHVIVVAMVFMAQAQAGDKLMWLGYLLLRFYKAVALHEGELLTAAVWSFRFNSYLIGSPDMAMLAIAEKPEARRSALFKHFQPHYAVAGVNMLHFVMLVIVFISVIVKASALLPPCSPHHPDSNADHQYG